MAQTKPLRDYVYLTLVAFQLAAILTMDGTIFYPSWLWKAPDAPLHFLVTLREAYVAYTGDPYYAHDITVSIWGPRPWFDAFLLIQIAIEFPFSVYLVRFLGSRRALPAAGELALMVHGILLAVTAAGCIWEAQYFTEADIPTEKYNGLVWGTYFPFALIPVFMVPDMYLRLLGRLKETKAKTQ